MGGGQIDVVVCLWVVWGLFGVVVVLGHANQYLKQCVDKMVFLVRAAKL